MTQLRLLLWFLVAFWLSAWLLWPSSGGAIIAGKAAPDIAAANWINSKPLSIESLRGRVVLVEFWTYG
jgi:hypothetical protein